MNRDQIHETYKAQLARIESNRALSDHARKVLSAKAYKQAAAQLEAARQVEIDTLTRQRAALQRRMFGQAGTADAQTVVARRDANDRAAQLDDPRKAADMLQRAEMEGDTLMAQAVAARAAQCGWGDVLTAYSTDRPGFADAAAEFNELPDPDDWQFNFRHTGQFIATPPSSLANANPGEVDRLAQQDLEVA
ncbi:hypothetical protein ACIO3O_19665 [Streptomyces sp. NPDC087440]|uniref:hypothetical protein n=1 Tax=Streptomyces sp. NPDC087440 TaxID=3365790 RepID=UPI0038135E25